MSTEWICGDCLGVTLGGDSWQTAPQSCSVCGHSNEHHDLLCACDWCQSMLSEFRRIGVWPVEFVSARDRN